MRDHARKGVEFHVSARTRRGKLHGYERFDVPNSRVDLLRYATTQDTFATGGQPEVSTVLNLNPITFSQADLIRLDGWEAKRRREVLEVQPPTKLSHFLRIIGAHLDKNAARTFSIFWTPNSVVLDYKRAGGYTDRLRLSPATIGGTIGGDFHRFSSELPSSAASTRIERQGKRSSIFLSR
jgi:hypothetical protein